MNNSNNKVVIVTGGGTGIGRAITEKFVENGAQVLIVGRRKDPLEELAQRYPTKIRILQADITKAEDRKTIVHSTFNHFGKIDVLVNNAGVGLFGNIQEITDENFEQSYLTNLIAPASLIREALPHLATTKGSVINISSVVAKSVELGSSAYACSKAALNQLTRILAVELGPNGIRVNAVAPGTTKTDMTKRNIELNGKILASRTPMRRVGEPKDIARVVYLLVSEDAGWVTGQILDASGGSHL